MRIMCPITGVRAPTIGAKHNMAARDPPSGEHRYFFRLYALNTKLNLPRGSDRERVENAMESHVIAEAELMGRYAAPREQPATADRR